MKPEDLIKHARSELGTSGKPRQADLLRAVSTAYYALFRCLCSTAAEAFIPAHAPVARAIVFRGFDHGKARDRCEELQKPILSKKLQELFSRKCFAPELRDFARDFISLQNLRHNCDYNPLFRLTKADAEAEIVRADQAIVNLRTASHAERIEFLAYVLFGYRP